MNYSRLDWHDMSDYVVHFTKPINKRSAYDNIISILWNGVLRAITPFGIAREVVHNPKTQRTVCLSEIPIHLISRLAERRGSYAIGFSKQFLLESGGGPVWYVELGGFPEMAVNELISIAMRSDDPDNHPIFNITPFIDSPGDYPGGNYRFEWEREWRKVGDLQFNTEDVKFLVIPEDLHEQARRFFEDAFRDKSGPAYFCPYIDTS